MNDEENGGREIMVTANQFKTLLERHGAKSVSRVNRAHLKRFLAEVIEDIERTE